MNRVEILILLRDYGKDTGVSVSSKHLSQILKSNNITNVIEFYKNDEELLNIVDSIRSDIIILQTPAFSYETLIKILEKGRIVNLAIHSTITYMQAEEGVFDKFIKFASIHNKNFSISNPCIKEIEGFKTYLPANFVYLPNLYSYTIDSKEIIKEKINSRCKNQYYKIGLFCEYRPFKNLLTQLTAISIAAKKIPVELHLIKPNVENQVYKYVQTLTSMMNFKTVWHEQCANDKLNQIIDEMNLGMQVSYTETFSYVIFEHMVKGVPTIGSSEVPFATLTPEFNNAVKIAEAIEAIFVNKEKYIEYSIESFDTACELMKKNISDVINNLKSLKGCKGNE